VVQLVRAFGIRWLTTEGNTEQHNGRRHLSGKAAFAVADAVQTLLINPECILVKALPCFIS
jgi:hypothetical protein